MIHESENASPPPGAFKSGGSLGIQLAGWMDCYEPPSKPPVHLPSRVLRFLGVRSPTRDADVRGNTIAARSIVEAIIGNSSITSYDLFPYNSTSIAGVEEFRQRHLLARKTREINVMRVDEFLRDGVDEHNLIGWLDPLWSHLASEGISSVISAYRLRAEYASRLYPIMSLQHGLSDPRLLYQRFLRLLLEETLPCDSIICTSAAMRRALQNILDCLKERFYARYGAEISYSGRIDLIPLCVDTEKFRPHDKASARNQIKLPQEAFIILTLGRMSVSKTDLVPFVGVLKWLVVNNPQRHILWVAAGTEDDGYSAYLMQAAKDAGIATRIKVMLDISNHIKQLLLPSSDVFVSLSDTTTESFGLAPIEAMACGVPQVVTNWDGYRDTVLHGETGFLLPTYWTDCCQDLRNTGAIAGSSFDFVRLGQSVATDIRRAVEFLQYVIQNDGLRKGMAYRSRQRALTTFSYAAVANQYDLLLRELLNIAGNSHRCKASRPIDETAYYRCFGHYASVALSDDTVLRASAVGQGTITETMEAFCHGSGVIPEDRRIRGLILDILRDNGRKEQMTRTVGRGKVEIDTIGELSNKLTHYNGLWNTSYILRNIMWMVKYGLIEVC